MKHFIGSRVLPSLLYHRPKNIQEALRMLNEVQGECKIIAGCTDLIPAIRRGAWTFGEDLNVIDITQIKEMTSVSKDKETIKIGAATRLSQIVDSQMIKEYMPILARAVNEMASLQIRNRGTIGGNICTASPAADTAPPLLVLDAKVRIRGIEEEEFLPLKQFFLGPGETVLGPRKVLTEIQLPVLKSGEKTSWIKLGRRNAVTLSVVSVATWVKIRNGIFEDVRIALGAVAPTPIRAEKTEEYLIGKEAIEKNIIEGAKLVKKEVKPISDVRASAEYRKDMARVLTQRALTAGFDI